MAIQGQNFPQISAPFVNEKLHITSAWRQFLQSLWDRTGGSQPSNVFTSGMVLQYAGVSVPNGWLICDGTPVLRSEYTALFMAISTTWGAGDGTTTFNLPNFTDKFAIGVGGSAIGSTGGAANVTLGTGNLPAHSHGVTDPGHVHTITDPGHVHTATTATSTNTAGGSPGSAVGGNTGSAATGISVNSATTGITIQNTGSGNPFAILPPYSALYYIIKT